MSMLFTLLLRNLEGPSLGCPHLPECNVVVCPNCETEYCEVHKDHDCSHRCSVSGCTRDAVQCSDCHSWVCDTHLYAEGCYFCAKCPKLPECNEIYCDICNEQYCKTHQTHECTECPELPECIISMCEDCGEIYCSFHVEHICTECPFTDDCQTFHCSACEELRCSFHDGAAVTCSMCEGTICPHCAVTCDDCGTTYCKDCDHTCDECPDTPDCDKKVCDRCGRVGCDVHNSFSYSYCDLCGKLVCSDCGIGACSYCGSHYCWDGCMDDHDCPYRAECPDAPDCDLWYCAKCGSKYCSSHQTSWSECENCGAHVCGGCYRWCDDCGKPICTICGSMCNPCGRLLCNTCATNHATHDDSPDCPTDTCERWTCGTCGTDYCYQHKQQPVTCECGVISCSSCLATCNSCGRTYCSICGACARCGEVHCPECSC